MNNKINKILKQIKKLNPLNLNTTKTKDNIFYISQHN